MAESKTGSQPIAYTVREAAQMVRVSERTIRRAIAAGKLRPIRFGRAVRVPWESLSAMLSPSTFSADDNGGKSPIGVDRSDQR